MATFRKQQDSFPESPEGYASSSHVALSFGGTTLLSAANNRRVSIYRRAHVEDTFSHSANFDDQVGKGFITDVAVTDNGEYGLIGDEDGRLVAFSTRLPLIAAEIETDIDCGHVVCCSISLDYVLASFQDHKKKKSCMALWRRPRCNLTDGYSLEKTWSHDDIGDNYDLVFRSCSVRNSTLCGRIRAAIVYWTDRQIHFVPHVDCGSDDNELSQAFTQPPYTARIVTVGGNTFVCLAAEDKLIRLDPESLGPMSLQRVWSVDGVTLNKSLSMSALYLTNNVLNTTLALLNKDRGLETYISV